METISLLGMLGVCTWEDIRKRKIHIFTVLLFGIAGLIMHLSFATISIWEILGGIAVGGALFIISIISGEKVGRGDALLIMVTGIYLGFWDNLFLLWAAAGLAGICGMILFMLKKRDFEIPFVPFVLAVYVLLLIQKGAGGV